MTMTTTKKEILKIVTTIPDLITSFSLCLYVCLSVSFSFVSVCLSVCLFVCMSVGQSVCMSVSVSVCLCISLCVEPHIMLNLNRYIRYTLSRFRFGVSHIKVHRSRFKLYNMDKLKCPLCLSAVENEVHFVLCCPAFDDLRYEFIESKYFNNPCEFRLPLLLATQNERSLKNIVLFLYKAFSRRKTLLS